MTDMEPIPDFLQRSDGQTSLPEIQSNGDVTEAAPTMEQLLERIRTLSAKKASITETIRVLKRQVQKMVGNL